MTTAPRKAIRYSRALLLAVALILPAASLIPLGSLWLWEHGVLVYWAIGTCIVVTAAYWLQRRLILPLPAAALADPAAAEPAAPRWSPQQAKAWADVQSFADTVKAERLSSRDAVLGLGLETIELVAGRLHPERRDPLLQFTVPEALAVIEQASTNLRTFLVTSFPLGDRITVAQLMWLYRWRGALQLAEKGYDLWRIVRLLNPISAATQEVRERFTRQLYEMGREHLAGRLARAFVSEVGRAAIDLYGGNLRVTAARLDTHVSAASRADLAATGARTAEPLRILIAGQTGAGKSSLVNALANAVEAAVDTAPATRNFTAYELSREGLPAALVIDGPGLGGAGSLPALIERADDCDMLLWVSAASRPAREIDRQALAVIRSHFVANPHRHRPPMLLVLTHIDALRPFGEWQPPYDLAAANTTKAQSIAGAMEAAGADLGFAAEDIVPVRVDAQIPPYNVDALWAKIIGLIPEAQRARLLRSLRDIKNESAWAAIWSQAAGAGRVIGGTFLGRKRSTAQ